MKVLLSDVTMCVDHGACKISDSSPGALSMTILGAPDEEIEPGQVLLVVGLVSLTVDARELADALLPFLARIERGEP